MPATTIQMCTHAAMYKPTHTHYPYHVSFAFSIVANREPHRWKRAVIFILPACACKLPISGLLKALVCFYGAVGAQLGLSTHKKPSHSRQDTNMLDGFGVVAWQHKSEDSDRRTWPLVEKAMMTPHWLHYILESDDWVTAFVTELISLPCFAVVHLFTCFLVLYHRERRAVKWHGKQVFLKGFSLLSRQTKAELWCTFREGSN